MSQQITIPNYDDAKLRAAENVFSWADQFTVNSPESYACAADELKAMKRQYNELEALRKSIVRPLDEARSKIQKLFAPALAYLDKGQAAVKKKMLDYQEAAQRAAQEAARAEADRLRQEQEALAALAEECGETEAAEDVRAQPVYVPVAEPVAAAGTWTTTRWHAELTDIVALCAAVAEGKAPAELVQINQPAANRLATALKGAVSYPGVRFESSKSMASRA